MFMARKGVYVNPFLLPKEMAEFLDKRDTIIQKTLKAATPSEKALVFETVNSPAKVFTVSKFCKEKGRVPLLLSTKK